MAQSVGVDIYKGQLDVALHLDSAQFSVGNDAGCCRELCRRLLPLGVREIGIKARGGYEY